MLNNIQNDNIADISSRGVLIEGISSIGTNEKTNNDKDYFIDESEISNAAIEKYQKEEDIKKFSEILMESDEQEATNKVLEDIFSQKYSIDDESFLDSLLNNEEFLNDVIK